MTTSTMNDQDLRQRALLRLKKKRDFVAHLVSYVIINSFVIAIWAMTGSGYFWPVFLILGWGIGLIFHAFDVYREPPTEADIEKEMDRLKRST